MAKSVYRIQFHNQGSIYELYARNVAQSGMYAFVEVTDIVFGERSNVLVDPAEEKLKSEFLGVKRCYLPIAAIVRIDEVEHEGTARIVATDGKVTPFPVQFTPTLGKG